MSAMLVIYVAVVLLLTAYGLHQGILLYFYLRRPPRFDPEPLGSPPLPPESRLPAVTVQVPVFNERYVVERIIRAVAALEYPKELLQIQILDDSTDETADIAARTVEAVRRAHGVDIELVRRPSRTGFKAGALAEGLRRARGELIAFFDADFEPAPRFLRRLVAERRCFEDPQVGFVQTRWTYRAREASWLTRAVAVLQDTHFFIEQPARHANGLLIQFNGSGGIWRAETIRDAGGWQHDTLTEDLDLCMRAQLRGWKGLYLADETVPSDLPVDVLAFKRQQSRWARGAMQTLRKLLVPILRSTLPAFSKAMLLFHLSAYLLQPLLCSFILLWPVLYLEPMFYPGAAIRVPTWLYYLSPQCLTFVGCMAVSQLTQKRAVRVQIREILGAIILGIGVCFSMGVAVAKGLLSSRAGEFERTPKLGDRPMPGRGSRSMSESSSLPGRYRVSPDWTLVVELLLGAYTLVAGCFLWQQGYRWWVVPMMLYSLGFWVTAQQQLLGAVQPHAPGLFEPRSALAPVPLAVSRD